MSTELINPFDGAQPSVIPQDTGALAAVTREQTEIQSAIIVAKKFPRNEAESYSRAVKSFERPAMAEAAAYRFPRGGTNIEGPSVDTAREIARCWKNIRYGLRIADVRHDFTQKCDFIKIKGYAHDLEANNYVETEDEFRALIQRKNKKTNATEWVQPDERDLRELVNRRGAICVRNALLQVLPPDVVDEVLRTARETLRRAAAGELEQNRDDAVRRLAVAFDRIAITVPMIERFLGHKLDVISDEELAQLRTIWKSISDGQARREEFFKLEEAPQPTTSQEQGAAITEALKQKADAAKQKTYKLDPEKKKAKPEPVKQASGSVDEVADMKIDTESSPFFGLTLGQVYADMGADGLQSIAKSTTHSDTERDFASRALKALQG